MSFDIDKFERAAEAHFDRLLDEYLSQEECRGCEDTPLNENCGYCGLGIYEIPCIDCGSDVQVEFTSEPSEELFNECSEETVCVDCRNVRWLGKYTFEIYGKRFATIRLPRKYTAFDDDGRWIGKFSDPAPVTLMYEPTYVARSSGGVYERFTTDLYGPWAMHNLPQGLRTAKDAYLERLREQDSARHALEATR